MLKRTIALGLLPILLSGCGRVLDHEHIDSDNFDRALACNVGATFSTGETLHFSKDDSDLIHVLILRAEGKQIRNAREFRKAVGAHSYNEFADLLQLRYDDENQDRALHGLSKLKTSFDDYFRLAWKTIVHLSKTKDPLANDWFAVLSRTHKPNENTVTVRSLSISLPINATASKKEKAYGVCEKGT